MSEKTNPPRPTFADLMCPSPGCPWAPGHDGPCPPMPKASATHPSPSAMAREAYPWDDDASAVDKVRRNEARAAYASGIAAERARIAAWLRERYGDIGEALADSLEGKS